MLRIRSICTDKANERENAEFSGVKFEPHNLPASKFSKIVAGEPWNLETLLLFRMEKFKHFLGFGGADQGGNFFERSLLHARNRTEFRK